MNFFKRPKYLLMILLASISFATFAPHFVHAQPASRGEGLSNYIGLGNEEYERQLEAKAAGEYKPNSGQATNELVAWIAIQLGHVVHLFTIQFPSIILLREIQLFKWIGTYNAFTTQTEIVQAWSTVRDLANMFFILILLLMSFGTILQIPGYGYRQLLSRLLLMAILINFSKSIVAILIDFSQIATLTFLAPVFTNIGGNLEAALGLSKIMQLPTNPEAAGSGYTGVSFLMAMILGGIMMIVTTVIMGVILGMFLMRIIAFWVLVILSPMAFLAKAFPKTSQYYSQWETELSKNLILGPGLAFFIWLAFSIAGQGNINSHFTMSDNSSLAVDGLANPDSDGSFATAVSKAATTANLLNFVVGISLLMAGLKFASASGAAGSSMAGKASGSLQKWGSRLGRGATIGAAAGVGALAWRGTSGEGGAKGLIGQGRGALGQGMATSGQVMGFGALQRAGMGMVNKEDKRRQKKEDYFAKRLEGMDPDEKKKYLETYGQGKVSKYFLGSREAAGLKMANELNRGIEVSQFDPHNMTPDQIEAEYGRGKKSVDDVDQAEVNKRKAQKYQQMIETFQRTGDKASLEKLRKRTLVAHNVDSFKSHTDQNGFQSVATIDPSVLDPDDKVTKEILDMYMAYSSKELGEMVEKMSPKIRDSFMKLLEQRHNKLAFTGDIGDDKSPMGKFAVLQNRFATNRTGGADAAARYDDLFSTVGKTAVQIADDKARAEKLLNNTLTNASGRQLAGITPSTRLYEDATGEANAAQSAEIIAKNAGDKVKLKAVVSNQVKHGNIANMLANSTARRYVEDSDADHYFDTESTAAAIKAGHPVGSRRHDDIKYEEAAKLAKVNLSHAHKAFRNDVEFVRFISGLNRDALSKLNDSELARIRNTYAGSFTPEKLEIINDIV